MLFNSQQFLFAFLPVTFAVFWLVQRYLPALVTAWLALASLFFYAWWDVSYLPVLVASITINLVLHRLIRRHGKPVLVAGISFNLALLFYFKYFNFFIDSVNAATGASLHWYEIVLPIGISFFTFQQIAFLADTYTGRIRHINAVDYAFFVSFFPQLIAGPIVHHQEIFSQLKNKSPLAANLAIGMTVFIAGLFKKVFLADQLSITAQAVFTAADGGYLPSLTESWVGMSAYSLQIYFDFSAYSDMAIGLGRIFGFKLPQNFASPYKATSISDFWRRWHITLSRFLKDYLYIPLGGNAKGMGRQKVNLMITMALGGLWHGASLSFLFWGMLHGVYLMINHWFAGWKKITLPRPVGWGLTMAAVMFAWVPFRAETMQGAIAIWTGLIGLSGISANITGAVDQMQVTVILFSSLIALVAPNIYQLMARHDPALPTPGYPATGNRPAGPQWRPVPRMAIATALVLVLCVFRLNAPSEFLYFQF